MTATGGDSFEHFKETHSSQLQDIPSLFWESLYGKLKDEIYDAGQYFTLTPLEDEINMKVVVSFIAGLNKNDSNNIFLVDHAWLYEPQYAKMQLTHVPGLATRMGKLMGILSEAAASRRTSQATSDLFTQYEIGSHEQTASYDADIDLSTVPEMIPVDEVTIDDVAAAPDGPPSPGTDSVAFDIPDDVLIDKVLEKMWSYNHSFVSPSGGTAEERVPLWYVMDEFGTAIRHSDTPSFAMAPFYYGPKQLSFNVIWCLRDLERGDEVTRDYVPSVKTSLLARACCLLPWKPYSLTLDDPIWSNVEEFVSPPIIKLFTGVTYPSVPDTPFSLDTSQPIKVFTDLEVVKSFLTDRRFIICDDREVADILWTTSSLKDFASLKPHQFVNQFLCEEVLVCKDLMATTARKARSIFPPASGDKESSEFPIWLPETYNLVYELPRLVKHYMELQERGEDNTWIIKPWNLARSIDTFILDKLPPIIRMGLASPKVACKYISNPVLFNRPEIGLVKFDIRYMLMLRSVQPLTLYAYNVFWLRFANKPFSMDDFSDYEKHFTVMNYKESVNLKQIHYDDFIGLFEQQYPSHKWADIQEKVFGAFCELFTAAVSVPAPQGIFPFSKSRAIYAIDLMLEWTRDHVMQPKVLEVNFSPDCIRACRYHSDFYNHMMSALFLDDTTNVPLTPICVP